MHRLEHAYGMRAMTRTGMPSRSTGFFKRVTRTVALFSVSVFYRLRIVPEHFWMSRRFLPVILPGALLFVCAAAFATTTGG